MVAQPAGTGTNQWNNVPLTAGQYVTYNGSAYVASNLPSAGGSGGGANLSPSGLNAHVDIFEDFHHNAYGSSMTYGALGLAKTTTGAGAAVSPISGAADAPGIMQIDAGTTSTGSAAVNNYALSLILTNGPYTNVWRIRIPTLPTGSESFTAQGGFMDSSSASVVDGAYWSYNTNDTHFVLRSANNSSRTAATNTTVVAANTWYTLMTVIDATASTATLYVNGGDAVSVSATMPSARATGVGISITKDQGTTARTVDVDYVYLGYDVTR